MRSEGERDRQSGLPIGVRVGLDLPPVCGHDVVSYKKPNRVDLSSATTESLSPVKEIAELLLKYRGPCDLDCYSDLIAFES